MAEELKPGDRVRVKPYGYVSVSGKEGTVLGLVPLKADIRMALIEFDEPINNGHEGRRIIEGLVGKKGHCWWIHTESLIKL